MSTIEPAIEGLEAPHIPVRWAQDPEMPNRWYAIQVDGGSWTISPDPERPGWQTDGGLDGYGLPEAIAKGVCAVLNAAIDESVFPLRQ